ncbi:Invasion protein IalB, involved in pathogenesis [Roseovarius litoreus]|uniref:Invasion protein IalB, involved in pathogenesis n=2 Tax=Roseovarius litoreus TaxID=1155722 RepID=A0A1M7FT84_9RHOB|nr:Invasion protein IalB, involved in pathogenesis [Roseovarius litoreus]
MARKRGNEMKTTSMILGIIAAAGMAATAQAQEAAQTATEEMRNGQMVGDWVVVCEAVTISQNQCRMVQEQSLRETGEMIARFIAVPVSDGAILLAQVPMGVYLPGGAVYRFSGKDEIEQRNMIWQRCADTVCEAAAPLSEEELALFAESEALLFGFRETSDGDPVVLSVGIEGFAEAIEKLRP